MNDKAHRYKAGGINPGLDGDNEQIEHEQEDVRDREVEQMADQNDRQPVPHRVRYESPKEGRTEVQFLLSDDDSQRIHELEALAKSTFSETVYLTDVKLAALRSGIHSSEELFLDKMREIGYGYFD